MRKVIVFQHVANEILGTLNPLLKKRGLRIRYVNFDRKPDEQPTMDRYNGLIILGGHMGVYEADRYTHIKVEMKMIEEAIKKGIPVLGICLGSQILAHVLGAHVRKHTEKEVGWQDVTLTDEGAEDPLFSHFKKTEKLFQMHGDTFDIPKTAKHLAFSQICPGQAFRYGDKVYGLQFHLEVDAAMIERWLKVPANLDELLNNSGQYMANKIRTDTERFIDHSMKLSRETFSKFIDLFALKERAQLIGSGHGKPHKPE